MKSLSLSYFTDPGHGWVSVKIDTLKNLGIADQISHYSYMRGKSAYLEEDCDLGLLLRTLDEQGIAFRFDERTTDKMSRIRNYDRYKFEG